MIVLDTNLVSEIMRPRAEPRVVRWLADLDMQSVFTTAITMAEIYRGVRQMPDGRRRSLLVRSAKAMFADSFVDRILPFDALAADAYADIVVVRRRSGRPISPFDAQIGGIALSREATLATRNVRDFEGCGMVLIDPWNA